MTLAWGAKISPAARSMVAAICNEVGILDPSWLTACIWFESRGDPASRNPSTDASGLINFMPKTAIGLGTTVEAIRAMSFEQQLELVRRYFLPYVGRLHTFPDVYMAILWPGAIGAPDDTVIFPPGSRAELLNRGLDIDHDGAVTKAEAASFPAKRLVEGLLVINVAEIPAAGEPQQQIAPPTYVQPAPRAPASIPERIPVGGADNSNAVTASTGTDTTGGTMLPTLALSFLQPLLAEVVGQFSGRAQATITQAGQGDPNIASQLFNAILQQIGASVGMPAIANNGDAVQAVAALRQQLKDTEATGGQQAAVIKKLEDQALDYLHTLTDAGAAMVQIRRDEVAISTASADAASNRKDARQLRAQVLRHVAYIFAALAGALLLFGIAQIVWGADHKVDGAIVGAFILAFGNAGGWYAAYVHFAVGTTESSGAKDMVIGGIATHNQAAKV